jgi:hypothetical protein
MPTKPHAVFRATFSPAPPDTAAEERGRPSRRFKHLADCLDLQAHALNKLGAHSHLARIRAMKFYSMANALDSYVRVCQDLVDEFLSRHDYIGAYSLR